MKKLFLGVVIFMIALANINVCSAVNSSEVKLGDISVGMSADEVIRKRGEPSSKLDGYAQLVHEVWFYGNNLEIGFLNKRDPHVIYIIAKSQGWATPSGIQVGMSINDVIKILGNNYKTETRTELYDWMKKANKPFLEYNWIGTRYNWWGQQQQVADELTPYVSVFVNDGKVTYVKVGKGK